MYNLYYLPGSCSMAVHIALIDTKVDHQLINVSSPDGTRPKEFLKINPRGSVPTIEFQGNVIREGMAILTHLLDNQENNLLPKNGLLRTQILEWLSFANSTLHPLYGRLFFMKKNFGDKANENPVMELTIKQIQKYWDEIEEIIKNNDYLLGNKIYICDILIAVIANWSNYFGSSIIFQENTKKYLSRVISYPSYAKAIEIEKIEYLANN